MIVSLRGANGAGKSTIVRAIMDQCVTTEVKYRMGRRKPTGQILMPRSGKKMPIFVPGHYEIANGGIDTMELADAYDLIAEHADLGLHVLYEGHNAEDGVKRLLKLHAAKYDCRVVLLRTPLDVCLARIEKRGHRIRTDRVQRLHAKLIRDYDKFEEAGLSVHHSPGVISQKLIEEWLL